MEDALGLHHSDTIVPCIEFLEISDRLKYRLRSWKMEGGRRNSEILFCSPLDERKELLFEWSIFQGCTMYKINLLSIQIYNLHSWNIESKIFIKESYL